MSDLIALLTAVQSNLDDRLARGVLADWLDDHGDPRAAPVRAAEDAVAAVAERNACETRLAPLWPPEPEYEDEADDPDGVIAARNQRRGDEHDERLRAYWQARDELVAATSRADLLLDACDAGWVRYLPADLVVRGFDAETFCGFVDALHARVSLLWRVRPGTPVPATIRTLYAVVGTGAGEMPAPAAYVPIPNLSALVVSAAPRARRWLRPLEPLAPADLEYLARSPWLARARELVLSAAEGRRELLAWAGASVPEARAERFAAVRIAGTGLPAGEEVRAFCASPLMAWADEVDLGTLLFDLGPAEIGEVMQLPFPGVRVLTVTCPGVDDVDVYDEGRLLSPEEALAAREEVLRAALGDAPARWAAQGREIRVRPAVPGPAVHPAELALRRYWTADDTRGGEDYDDYPPRESATDDGPDASVTPTRRELYRGRFRNPRR